MARTKKSKTIKKSSALRVNRGRSVASRALDAVRSSKKIDTKPTKAWAKNPSRRDVKGIDDGTKQAKLRNKSAITQHFGEIGKKGALITNAKKSKDTLVKRRLFEVEKNKVRVQNEKEGVKIHGIYSYEAEHRLPQAQARLNTSLEALEKAMKTAKQNKELAKK